jgi:NADH-quinone oxidoreductase subunit M
MSDDALRVLVILLLAVPAAGATLVALLGSRQVGAIRWTGLGTTLVSLVIAVVIAVNFAELRYRQDAAPATSAAAPTFTPEYVPGAPCPLMEDGKLRDDPYGTSWDLFRLGTGPGHPAIQFYIGIDGLNIWLVVLTAVLMVSAVLVSWTSIEERVAEYYAWLLLLQMAMTGVFLSFDIVLFYIFFELTLVPLFFVIGIWGGPQRRYAARKFFIYTLAGSLFTLLGVLLAVVAVESKTQELTFSIPRLVDLIQGRLALDNPAEKAIWHNVEFWVFLALIAGFSIKVPLVPLHTWLPLAHVEAPTAGSVLLAGVLLKVGSYGFLRLCLPLAPDASLSLGLPLIGTLGVIGVVYGSMCALAQSDIKRLVAYSSVAHMGFVMVGMFALNITGLSGSLLQMINHGLSTGALFLLVGMLYDRYHTRQMHDYGGLGARLPLMACAWVFIVMTSIALPGLNGFVGEILVLMGVFNAQYPGEWPVLAVVAVTGVVLGAWYLLTLLMRVFCGPVKEPEVGAEHGHHGPVRDLSWRELAALAPIAALCVAIGTYPQPFFDTVQRDLDAVTKIVKPDMRVAMK